MPNGNVPRSPNSAIVVALNALRGAADLKVLGTPVWFGTDNGWAFPVEIVARVSSDHIPPVSRWFITLSDIYPAGEVCYFPAKEGGITCTFPHQALNISGSDTLPWRKGKLCLESQVRSLGGYDFTEEPFGDAELRMLWYAERASQWIKAAAEGTLLRPGDPFELPDYRGLAFSAIHVVHDEGPASMSAWTATMERIGRIFFAPCPPPKDAVAVYRYETFDGRSIREGSWRYKPPETDIREGVWWLWPGPIILEPWQAPVTWRDLSGLGIRLGVDLIGGFKTIISHISPKVDRVILLLGFPIPRKVGEANSEIHWKAIDLPVFRPGGGKAPHGFRKNAMGLERKFQLDLADDRAIPYLMTSNWHPDRLRVRGRFGEKLRDASVGIIGVGSLGSAVAELLARGGVKTFVLVDGENIGVGNLSRHVLTLHDLSQNKAIAVAERLQSISPHLSVVPLKSNFPSTESVRMMDGIDVLIDCTASDGILSSLASTWFRIPKLFVSLSLGFRARRLYCFTAYGNTFPAARFRDQIRGWMDKEKQHIAEDEEIFEGAGCWSPLFPARYEDVVLAAATSIKEIESRVNTPPPYPSLVVYEQKFADNIFVGYDRTDGAETGGTS
ncbi:MAG: ThiF family adenylyltransferase [Deltaproteobacteria bacterium]|nr:ThiF family adenylyltransferase [Deltaproteobacteria bacterium]